MYACPLSGFAWPWCFRLFRPPLGMHSFIRCRRQLLIALPFHVALHHDKPPFISTPRPTCTAANHYWAFQNTCSPRCHVCIFYFFGLLVAFNFLCRAIVRSRGATAPSRPWLVGVVCGASYPSTHPFLSPRAIRSEPVQVLLSGRRFASPVASGGCPQLT